MLVLGLETSCDETAIALYEGGRGLLAHTLHSQVLLHAEYGGIVPELASRDHIAKILPLLEEALRQAQRPRNAIQGIAYTAGPGLIGALLVGATFAKGLGYALNVPTVAIHHMEGHLLASLLEQPMPDFPFIALLVSGGHTLLVEVRGLGQYQLLGESLDDAAGEAFDKTAKLLGLGYPGGPVLAELAKSGKPGRFHFPRPLTEKPGLDFSFSGLKTFTLYTFQNTDKSTQDKADIAYEFQDAVTDTLVIKCQRALQQTGLQRLVVAGGVGANLVLRDKLQALSQKLACQVYFPRVEFCTDNAAMIAFAGYLRLQRPVKSSLEIKVQPRWHMDTLKE